MLSDSLLCSPLPAYTGWFTIASLWLTYLCFQYADKKENYNQLTHFLILFFPYFGFIYLYFSKGKGDEKVNTFMLLAWIALLITLALRRLCF